MFLDLSDQQKFLKNSARDFAQKEFAPLAAKLDEAGQFPSDNLKKLAQMGYMGVMVPEEWGGIGLGFVDYIVILEEVCAACPATGGIMSVHNSLICGALGRFGNEAQKKKYLVPVAKGDWLGAYCLTEPGTGSDAANIKTKATLNGDHYLINGAKNWITSGPNADVFIVFAVTDASKGPKGISAFIVEKTFKGFSVGKTEKKMGLKSSHTSGIHFDNCEVPKENLLLGEGQGFQIAMQLLESGRIGIATQAIGIARAALDEAIKYSKQREAFGKTISNFQAIQHMLADMSTRLEASRLLAYKAAFLKDQNQDASRAASQAKLYASESAGFITDCAVQIHGGYGYSQEYPVEKLYRDARVTRIYEGTSEIQRMVIARSLLK